VKKKKKMCLREAFQLSSFPGPGTFVCVAVLLLLLLADAAMVMLRRLMTSRSVAPSDAKTKSIQPWQTIVVCTSNSHDLHSYSIPIISPFFFLKLRRNLQ
jgi:hypothetical protein